MTQNKDKARQWDGKSRPTNDLYSKRWNEILVKRKIITVSKERMKKKITKNI